VNIAERASYLAEHKDVEMPAAVPQLTEKVQVMLRKSLDALVNMDAERASEVLSLDDEVDEIHRKMYKKVQKMMCEHPEKIDGLVQWLSVSRCLERIADQAENIAEDVLYMIEGEIVRHQKEAPPH